MMENKEKMNNSGGKLGVDLNQLVFNMIGELPERSRDIIIKRFNLDDKGEETLEEIGKEYEITRERIRQIESEAIFKLKDIEKKYNISKVFNYIEKIIEEHGGVISEERLVDRLFDGKWDIETNKRIMLLILALDDRIKKEKETKTYKKLYFYQEENFERFKETINKLEKYLEESKKVIDFDRIVNLVSTDAKSKGLPFFFKEHIRSYLDANKIILKNILGEWGHQKWPNINPKSVRDKAYLALKKNKKPLHFVEITNKINEIWHDRKRANNQTVHNELIKDERFVLMGRGIYALKEWGYRPGTVLDVIMEVLKEKGGEMGQEEIIQEVLKRRQVMKNTVVINLQNKEYFEKLEGKVYRLK